MKRLRLYHTVALSCALAAGCASPRTYYREADVGTLARAAQNPVSSLTSLAVENEFRSGVGPNDDLLTISHLRLSWPVPLDDDWNVVNRLDLPVIDQPELSPGAGDHFGVGNLVYTAFITLAAENQGILAFGPVVVPTTASSDALGPDSWAAGLAFAMLRERGPWVWGVQALGYWNVPGDANDDIGLFEAQPIVDYNLDDGWYLTSTPKIRADWDAKASNRWTIPVGGGVGRVFDTAVPVNARLQAFYDVETPDDGPEWEVLFELQLLLTKRGSASR